MLTLETSLARLFRAIADLFQRILVGRCVAYNWVSVISKSALLSLTHWISYSLCREIMHHDNSGRVDIEMSHFYCIRHSVAPCPFLYAHV